MASGYKKPVRCPYCHELTPPAWESLYQRKDKYSEGIRYSDVSSNRKIFIDVYWTQCHNDECGHVIVRVRRGFIDSEKNTIDSASVEQWWAVPRRGSSRRPDALVGGQFRKDYLEATAILEDSPRMSAVLARCLLADILKEFAGRSEFGLKARINKFLEDQNHPEAIKANLHYLREIGDFGAHTQKDQLTDEIIPITREEAEFTLDVIDGLLDYFVVGPKKQEQARAAFDEKIEKAGRKPIPKPSI